MGNKTAAEEKLPDNSVFSSPELEFDTPTVPRDSEGFVQSFSVTEVQSKLQPHSLVR